MTLVQQVRLGFSNILIYLVSPLKERPQPPIIWHDLAESLEAKCPLFVQNQATESLQPRLILAKTSQRCELYIGSLEDFGQFLNKNTPQKT